MTPIYRLISRLSLPGWNLMRTSDCRIVSIRSFVWSLGADSLGEVRSAKPELEADEMAPSCDEGRTEKEAEGESDSAMFDAVLSVSLAYSSSKSRMCKKVFVPQSGRQEPVLKRQGVAADVVQSGVPPSYSHSRACPRPKGPIRCPFFPRHLHWHVVLLCVREIGQVLLLLCEMCRR